MRRADLVLVGVCTLLGPWWVACGEEFAPGSSTTGTGGASAGGAGGDAAGGAGATGGAGGDGGQGVGGQGGEGLPPTCQTACTKWEAQGCAPDECLDFCEELFLFSACQEEAQSLVTCLVLTPNLCQGRHCQAEAQAHGECVEVFCTENPDQPDCMD